LFLSVFMGSMPAALQTGIHATARIRPLERAEHRFAQLANCSKLNTLSGDETGYAGTVSSAYGELLSIGKSDKAFSVVAVGAKFFYVQ
jgi:hypothetical protein